METESTINPGIWQSLKEGNMKGGYGLVQWTPSEGQDVADYFKWAEANKLDPYDVDTQLARIQYEVENNKQWQGFRTEYNMSFKEFTQSDKSVEVLASIFMLSYERPDDKSEEAQRERGNQAEDWLEYFQKGYVAVPDDKNKAGTGTGTSTETGTGAYTGTYTVRAGDTLGKIAAKLDTTVAELAKLNDIKDVNVIYTGQKLIVPGDHQSGSRPDDSVTNSQNNDNVSVKYKEIHHDALYGDINYKNLKNKKGDYIYEVEVDPKWVKENITTISVPKELQSALGYKEMKIHKLAVPNWEKVFELLQKEYKDGKTYADLIETCGGVYYPRHIKGSNKPIPEVGLSNHSFGSAIDINANKKEKVNIRNKDGTIKTVEMDVYQQSYNNKIDVSINTHLTNYILYKNVFEPAGFGWGAYYTSAKPDGMHFEIKTLLKD
jgi:LysM repeat protein